MIDHKALAIRAKLEKQRDEKKKFEAKKRGETLPDARKGGALDIFRNSAAGKRK